MECISLCAWYFLFFAFCQPVHSFIKPSLHGLDFFFWLFVTWCRPRNCGLCVMHPCTCVDKWRLTASTLCPLSLPRKEVHAQSKPWKGPFPENFVTIGGCFERYTLIYAFRRKHLFPGDDIAVKTLQMTVHLLIHLFSRFYLVRYLSYSTDGTVKYLLCMDGLLLAKWHLACQNLRAALTWASCLLYMTCPDCPHSYCLLLLCLSKQVSCSLAIIIVSHKAPAISMHRLRHN